MAHQRRNDSLGGPQFSNIGLSRPLLNAACKSQAEEAQRKIDERHAKAKEPPPKRRTNSRYSDEVVARARDLSKTMGAYAIARRMNIPADTIMRWLDGVTRAPSAATAKRCKIK
jgi:hypothetical protein